MNLALTALKRRSVQTDLAILAFLALFAVLALFALFALFALLTHDMAR